MRVSLFPLICLALSLTSVAQQPTDPPATPAPAPTAPATAAPAATAKPAKFQFSLDDNASVSLGAQVNLIITAVDQNGAALASYSGDVLLQTTDSAATLPPNSKASLTAGSGTAAITFSAAGKQIVTVTGSGVKSTLNLVVNSNVAGCSSCFATIGAGAALYRRDISDYQNVQNVLQKTHLGNSTPQYLVGLAYKLPWHTLFGIKFGSGGSLYTRLDCHVTDFNTDRSDARSAYCYPFKAFINFKFSPDASQTFSGFTYGISHALHKNLDILLGLSYTPYSEISPGFQSAALNTYTTQTAAQNPCYKQFSLTQLNDRNAYDGVPTQILTNTGTPATPVCTAGAQIYTGAPLVTEHHSGVFIGIAIPVSFKNFLK